MLGKSRQECCGSLHITHIYRVHERLATSDEDGGADAMVRNIQSHLGRGDRGADGGRMLFGKGRRL